MTYSNGMIQQNNEYLKEYSVLNIGILAGIVSVIGGLIALAGFPRPGSLFFMILDAVLIYRWANTANAISNENNTVPQTLVVITCIVGMISMIFASQVETVVSLGIQWYLIAKIWRRSVGYNSEKLHVASIVYLTIISLLCCISLFVNDDESANTDIDSLDILIVAGGAFVWGGLYASLQYLFNGSVRVYKKPPNEPHYRGLWGIVLSTLAVIISIFAAFVLYLIVIDVFPELSKIDGRLIRPTVKVLGLIGSAIAAIFGFLFKKNNSTKN